MSLSRSKSYGRDSSLSKSLKLKGRSDHKKSSTLRSSMKQDHLRSNSKNKNELTSITRLVGSRIRSGRKEYISAFKKSNGYHPSKLISDKELLRALKSLDIILEHGDEKKLLLEIDTQNIRNAKRMFSYEKFLEKAGIDLKPSLTSPKSIDLKMSRKEIKIAEEEIEEIKKELRRKDLTLYEAVDILPSDLDIPWVTFGNGLKDNLKKYWIQLSSDKDRLVLLKLYLCEGENNSIDIERLNKIFGIEHQKYKNKDRKEDKYDLFNEEEGKN